MLAELWLQHEVQFPRRARDGSLPRAAAVKDLVQLAGNATHHRPLLVRDQGRRRQGSIVKSLWQGGEAVIRVQRYKLEDYGRKGLGQNGIGPYGRMVEDVPQKQAYQGHQEIDIESHCD